MSSDADNPNLLTQAIAEYMRRVDAGESVDREQFLHANAPVGAELRQYLDNVALVEQMAGPTPTEHSQSAAGDGARRETVSASQGGDSVPEKKATVVSGPTAGKFGRYKIEKTLGEGAMGTVFLARDTQLDRRVALKVPKFKDDDTEMMERFYREARSAAKLRHRHICPVHDIGEIDGIKYISIGFIDGHPLSAYVSEEKPQSERNVAIIVRKLALALDVAHREGVIHRDLKPANVMVDKKTEPVIMDFGLARQMNTNENERLTQTGTIMGSPAYMSPEQVNADNDKIGPCSDIYSLGVMLYELLTGKLPFEGSIAAVIGQILMKEPDKPSTFRPDLDPRIEEICAKMMAKEIDERYTSMKDVADALTAYLKNPTRPGGKRSVGKLESFAPVELKEVAKQSKKGRRTLAPKQHTPQPAETFTSGDKASGGRQPADRSKLQTAFDRLKNLSGRTKAIAGGFAALLLVLGITIIIRIGDRTVEVTTDKQRLEAEGEVEGNGFKVTATAGEPQDSGSAAAGWVTPLHQFDDADNVKGIPDAVSFWPDGNSIVDTFGPEKKLRRRDALTGEAIDFEFAGEIAAGVECLAFSADGNLLAVGKSDGRILIWDLQANQMKKVFNATNMPIRSVSFSRNDARLLGYAAKAPSNALILGWDVLEDQAIKSFSVRCYNLGFGRSIAFSPDGTQVAAARISGPKDGVIELWNIADSKQPVRSFDSNMSMTRKSLHEAIFDSVIFSPDGKHLIASSDGGSSHRDGFVHVWDAASGREILSCLQKQTVSAVAITPDSRWIVSSDFLPRGESTTALGTLTVWDAQTGQKAHSWPVPAIDAKAELRVKRIEFSPDGKRFFTAGQNTPTTVWELNPSIGGPAVRLANAPPERLDDLATGEWVPVFTAASDTKTIDNTAAMWRDGVLELVGEDDESKFAKVEAIAGPRGRNVILRAEVNLLAGHHAAIGLRSPDTSADFDYINTHISGNACSLWRSHSQSRKGGGFHVDLPPNDNTQGFRDLAIALVDGHVAAYVDGRRVAEQSDWSEARNFSPELHMFSFDKKEKTRAQFRNVRMMVLNDKSSDLPTGQWVRLLENEEQLKQWQATNLEPTFNEGTVGLAREKPAEPNENRGGSLARLFDTTARRFIVHVRHKKVTGFMAGESVGIGSHGLEVSHFGPEKHELWTPVVNNGKQRSKRTGLYESTDGFGEFADFDYVVIDGEFTAYLNGQKMYSHTASAAPLTSISLDVRAFEDDATVKAEWKDVAVMRLSNEQIKDIRAGNLPKYVPASDSIPDVLTKQLKFFANVSAVRFSGDGKHVIGFSWGHFKPFVWDAATGKIFKRAEEDWGVEDGGGATAMATSPIDSLVVVGNFRGRLVVWNYESGKIKYDLKGHTGVIQEVVFTPDGKQIVSSTKDGKVCIWSVESGKQERALGTAEKTVDGNSLAISPNGRQFVEGGNRRLNFRDLASGNIVWSKVDKSRVFYTEAAFSSDGKRLATYLNGEENQFQILDAADGSVISTISDLPDGLAVAEDLRFFADDRLLLSAHKTATLVWNVADGRLLQQLHGTRSVDVSADGKWVVAKDGPGLSRCLYRVDEEKLRQVIAGPAITAENVTIADGWIDLLTTSDPALDATEGKWNQDGNELVGSGRYTLPIRPKGNFEWETTFTLSNGGGFVNFSIPDQRGFPFAEMIGSPGLRSFQPAGSQANARTLQRAAAVSTSEKHVLQISRVDQNDETTITATIDGKPWAAWSGKTKALDTRSESELANPQIVARRQVTIHTSRLRMLDGEAKLLRGQRSQETTSSSQESNPGLQEYQQLTAGSWTRVLNKRSEFSRIPDARLTTTGTLTLGTVAKGGDAHVGIREATGDDYLKASDFALRMKVKRLQGRNFYFLFRQVKSNGYVVSTNGRDTISAIRKIGFSGLERQITGPQTIEVDNTDWVEWMLVARGSKMTVYADGREVLTFTDTDFQSGGIAIGSDQSRMQFKEVELQLLQSGTSGSTAVPAKGTPARQWLAPKVNSDEIKRALAGLQKNGFFGRPPNIKAMEQYTTSEVARRKADGRISPNGKFEFRFNSVGKIVFESASDSPPPSGLKTRGGGGGSGIGKSNK